METLNSPIVDMPPALQRTLANVQPISRIDIVVSVPKDLNRQLDQAVLRLIPTAVEHKQGILVTRTFPDRYTVELDEVVPYGTIWEKQMAI